MKLKSYKVALCDLNNRNIVIYQMTLQAKNKGCEWNLKDNLYNKYTLMDYIKL